MQVFKYYSYASNTEKGEVRSAFKAPGGYQKFPIRFWEASRKMAKDQKVFGPGTYRKFPTGNFGGTGNSGLNRKFGFLPEFPVRSTPRQNG